jgi:ribosome-binding ATPase YchF (GTP1/OBG family)
MLIGLVGKPSSGKSTFFKAATLAEVPISPVPFTTIKPNTGVAFLKVECPEDVFKLKCKPKQGFCLHGIRFVPANLMDVAGLVPGAHTGLGLGNQFLNDLSTADILIHVVDVSGTTNEKGEQVLDASYDPSEDIEFLEVELDIWFYNLMKRSWDKFSRQTTLVGKDTDKAIAEQFTGLKITLDLVRIALNKCNLQGKKLDIWTELELKEFSKTLRKVSKPIVIAANKIDMSKGEENYNILKEKFPNLKIIPCSSEVELALREAAKSEAIDYIPGEATFKILDESKIDEKQTKALDFIKTFLSKWKSSGVQNCLNYTAFDVMKQIVVYPVATSKLTDSQGRILPDAFLLPEKSAALDLAYRLHTDFGKNFIRAIDVKTKKTVGKDHILKNGDVIEIIAKT